MSKNINTCKLFVLCLCKHIDDEDQLMKVFHAVHQTATHDPKMIVHIECIDLNHYQYIDTN